MQLLRFVFPFLYIRNWHTGRRELSWARTFMFVAMVSLVTIAVVLAVWLQTPIIYNSGVAS